MLELCLLLLGANAQLPHPRQSQCAPRDRLCAGCCKHLPIPPLLLHGLLHPQVPRKHPDCMLSVLIWSVTSRLECSEGWTQAETTPCVITCSCSKMRYKAEFKPSDLLCMHLGCWVPAERAVPALDADMHCVISQVKPLHRCSSITVLLHEQLALVAGDPYTHLCL